MDRIDQQMGNYRLVRLVGQGHFADVYLGEHLYLKTFAAIKILHAAVNQDTLQQFLQEAQAIAHLHHPHIVSVFDFGVDASSNTPFLVMEYARHGSLRHRYPEGQRLRPQLILLYVQQIASALQYAHNHRLIHRDVKPENILLGAHNEILLSDFSLVTVAHSTASLKTLDNAGTVHYMAPEQLQGKPRPASDQYSLAVMVYEWLCGERPFDGSTPIEIAVQHITVPLPSLQERMPNLSPAIVSVVHRALEKDPKQRFPTVLEFAQALAVAIEQSRVPAVSTDASPVITTGPVTGDDKAEEVYELSSVEPSSPALAESAVDSLSVPSLEPSIVRLWQEDTPPFASSPIQRAPVTPSALSSSSYYTVLDIGSTYARAAIVRLSADGHAEVLGVGRFNQQEGNLLAGMVNDVDGTVTACNEALLKAERMAGKLIAPDALIGIGSELMRGASLTINMERATPAVPIAMNELEALIEQAAQALVARLRQQFALLTGERSMRLDIIDMVVSSISIDGQSVADPFGMPGRELSFQLFVNCIPHAQRLIISEVIEKLDLNMAALITTPAALAHYMQGSDEFASDAVLLDVGGGVTRIALVFGDRLTRVGAFAFGGEDFTLRLADQMHIDRESAEHLKLSYGRGVLKGGRRSYVQTLLVPEYQRWLDELARQLEVLVGDLVPPSTFYLAGGGLSFPDFRQHFSSFRWVDYLAFPQAPQLYPIKLERHPWINDTRSLLRDSGEIALVAIGTSALLPSPSPMNAILLQFLNRHLSSPSS
ncbi:protein kinase [Ktedonobacteria bacterium brp13]|nr:protein kinase [Ktedonobacteria bacterium brp13]